MKIILSPAKKMVRADDDFAYESLPVFLAESEQLLAYLKSYDYAQLKKIWNCSDTLARTNQQRLERMDLRNSLSPALFTYSGLAYQHMAPGAMTERQLDYLRSRLLILSGFYGVLKPFDGVVPYRLEMQASLPDTGALYDYWKDKIYNEVTKDGGVILNLASKEYSRCVESWLGENDIMITAVFAEIKNGKPITKGTMAKMARGEMTYWLSENEIEDVHEIRKFDAGYAYSELLSTETEYVFVRKNP